jgi:hypothetical protein
MRIPKKFGERTTHFDRTQYEKKKYVLAYEGQETEVQYFQGVIDSRESIGIDPIIDMLPLLRSNPQLSHSHPLRIIQLIEEHIEQYDSLKVVIDKTIDYCVDIFSIDDSSIYNVKTLEKDLKMYVQETRQLNLKDSVTDKRQIVSELVQCIETKLELTNQIENIVSYIEDQQILFSKGWDYLCLIIDRDKGNVKEYQYSEILKKCEEKSIRLFVSNPSFEFWLLLHSDKVFEYDAEELLLNQKTGNKRYLERVLSEVYEGYRKGDIKFERFAPFIKTAIANEKKFCEDIVALQEQLGSNIGTLLFECIVGD